jgi:hypothetical protein
MTDEESLQLMRVAVNYASYGTRAEGIGQFDDTVVTAVEAASGRRRTNISRKISELKARARLKLSGRASDTGVLPSEMDVVMKFQCVQ